MGKLKGRGVPSKMGERRMPSRLAARGSVEVAGPRRSVTWNKTARWQKLRLRILERDKWVCQATGILLVGVHPAPNSPVVDHIEPHRGDPDLFWDEDNLRAVSKEWHDREKQSQEKRGLA